MARYIDADKLKDAFHTDTEHLQSRDEHLFDLIMIEIEDAPTADVVEVKHGEWLEVDSDVGWELVRCSSCGKEQSLFQDEEKPLYCPRCGAKMDGERK